MIIKKIKKINNMRKTSYAKSEYIMMTHNRFKCYYTRIDQPDGMGREAHSVSIPDLTYTKFTSQKLSSKTARTLGEMLLKIAEDLED